MLAVGIDSVEIKRIQKSISNPRFCERVFGKTEYSHFVMRGFPVESMAASFCAKEAFAKALGTGVRGFSLYEVELLHDELGAPYLYLSGDAKKIADERNWNFAVSVTHTKEIATTIVIAEKREI